MALSKAHTVPLNSIKLHTDVFHQDPQIIPQEICKNVKMIGRTYFAFTYVSFIKWTWDVKVTTNEQGQAIKHGGINLCTTVPHPTHQHLERSMSKVLDLVCFSDFLESFWLPGNVTVSTPKEVIALVQQPRKKHNLSFWFLYKSNQQDKKQLGSVRGGFHTCG